MVVLYVGLYSIFTVFICGRLRPIQIDAKPIPPVGLASLGTVPRLVKVYLGFMPRTRLTPLLDLLVTPQLH